MSKVTNLTTCLMMSVLFLATLCTAAEGKIIYVDDDATSANNGSSWADAYWCLQDALADAQSGDEIRVAQGIYKPDREVVTRRNTQIVASGDRTTTFQLKNGVTVKGGYAGFGQPNPDAQDTELYETILSGDLNGNDGPDFTNNSENSYHVVTGSRVSPTEVDVLAGFTIMGGNADGPPPHHDKGGGMYNDAGSPTVINCTFSGNSAQQVGGGMDNSDSHPRLTNCTFIGNRAELKYGGGIRNYNSTPTLINCIFTGNSGGSQAGGMFNHNHSNPSLINCTFSANTAARSGGISNALESNPTLTNCILWGNLAVGAVNESAQIQGGTPVINYCCIKDWTGMLQGIGNHGLDPQFVDSDGFDNVFGTEDDNLRLLRGSPCINAGNNSVIPPSVVTDLDGNPRIRNRTVDMGAYERPLTLTVYCVDAINGDDNNDGLTPEEAFATIQKGIDTAEDGEVVLVSTGVYQEEVNFLGKALTVQGVPVGPAGAPVLWNPDDFAVSFYYGEGPGSILKNFIIRDSFMGVFIADSSPTISNLTIVGNKYGIEAYAGSEPDISNCILWNNSDDDLFQCQARYSCIERGGQGEGNITIDPIFVDPDNGDYHLRSERGRYWPEHDIWVLDKVTSPCVDGGDPGADPLREPMPNGSRINMGAYGSTPQASLSPICQPPGLPGRASNPYPADGAVDVGKHLDLVDLVILTWTAGLNAVSHDVYFGTDGDAVANADTSDATGTYRGRQSATSYIPLEGAGWRTPFYYWRIDEVDSQGNKTTGDVWTFTTITPLLMSVKASNPDPADGAVGVDGNVTLFWIPGLDAVLHNVYFGVDFDHVNQSNVDDDPWGVLVSSHQEGTRYAPPGILELGQTYYWRIDGVDNQGMIITGEVWSFTPGSLKGRTCFTGNTPVWINGTLIPISKAAPGQVMCGTDGHSKIEELQEHTGMFTCYDILLESGNCISVAECHYFLTESGRWISLQNLKAGTRLQTSKGSVGIISITRRPMPYVGKVYNLKVEGSDRYLVGEDAVIVRDY